MATAVYSPTSTLETGLPVHRLQAQIAPEMAGMRLDQALAALFPEYSRSKLQQCIRTGDVWVDGAARGAKVRVSGGEQVEVRVAARLVTEDAPEAIPLTIVYEDDALLVVDKPAGLVVHPAAGHRAGTLVNALLHHAPQLARMPRAGIVHRLDKDTTGLLVVAKIATAAHALVAQLQARTVTREYLALVQGRVTAGGSVIAPIGRHPTDRLRFAVRDGGKPSISHYRIAERLARHTLLRVSLETGRTHQIRVHMAHLRMPLVGDPLYGGRLKLPAGADAAELDALREFQRQALHAAKLSLVHPQSGDRLAWEAPLPADFAALLTILRRARC